MRRVGLRAARVAAEGKGAGERAAREVLIRVATVVRSIGGEVNVSVGFGEDMMGGVGGEGWMELL